MVIVTVHSRFTEAYSRFLTDNKVSALVQMCSAEDETTFTMSAEDEMRIRGLWNVKDYSQYICY